MKRTLVTFERPKEKVVHLELLRDSISLSIFWINNVAGSTPLLNGVGKEEMQFPVSPVERSSAPTDIHTCAEEEVGLDKSIEIQNLEL